LMHCGFFEAVSITDLSGEPEPQKRSVSHDYKLTIPQQSEISENKTPKQSEISDRNSPRSQTIVHKVLNQNQLPIIPLTPGRGWEGKSQDSNQPMSGIKGSIGYAIQEVIEKTPWLLAGSIYDSKKEITKVLLGTPADTLIKALVLNGEHSLLRTHGYHGSQRKRGVKMELECILDKLHKNVIFIPEWKEQENPDSFPSYPPFNHPDWYVNGEFEYVDNWDVSSFLPSLKSKMGSQFTIWIEPLELKMVRLGSCPYPNSDERNPFIVALVQAPNRHFLEWVKENYTSQIRSTIPSHIEVLYVEREELPITKNRSTQ